MKLGLVLAVSVMSVAAYSQTLSVGDKAPAIKVESWIKGNSVKSFKKGKVYVLEFWATWCKPCVAAMPHVSKLATKFKGKVEVMGISVSDRPLNEIAEFVKKKGDDMSYSVARDTQSDFMKKNWLIATKTYSSIPLTFIVNQSGRIAWIGHPMTMDEPLEQIVAGRFDMKAFKTAFEAERKADVNARAESAKSGAWLDPIFAKVNGLMFKKEYEDALSELTLFIDANPKALGSLGNWKLNLMIALKKPGVEEFMKSLLGTEEHKEAGVIEDLLSHITGTKRKLSPEAYQIGATFARRLVPLSKDNWQALNEASMAFFLAGEKEAAVQTIKAAIEAETKVKANSRATKEQLDAMLERLKQYGG